MKKLMATYRIVTPMFIGDAVQMASSIRPPSIKGALRFWWRALNWGRCLERERGDVVKALQTLHREEGCLFGAAVEEKGGGQGKFLLQVVGQPKKREKSWPLKLSKAQKNLGQVGSSYFGFGLWEDKTNSQHREAISEGQEFSISLCFKPYTAEKDVNDIKETLKVFGLFGGLGSRSRRGFGSVALTELVDGDISERFDYSLDDYRDISRQAIVNNIVLNKIPFSAFSKSARFEIVAKGGNAREVHNKAGIAYKEYRKLDKVERVPFGLPLTKVDDRNRRASPLFFHVHALQGGSFVVGALFLPAFFHTEYAGRDLDEFYQPISHFLSIHGL